MGSVKKFSFYNALVRVLISTASFLLIGAALAAIISPLEFIRMRRDRQRVSDLKKLSELIELAQFKAPAAIQAEENTVYISLPDDNPNCAGWKNKNLPPLADKFSYRCSRARTYRAVNGLGWLPINFISVSAADIQELPIDPANGRQSQDLITGKKRVFFYQYIKGSFSLGAFSERPLQVDEVYSAVKKREAVRAVLGIKPTEVTIGGGGQMIVAGAVDLSDQANAPAIAAAGKNLEKEAALAALKEVAAVIEKLPPPRKEATADQTAAAILRGVGVVIAEMPTIQKAMESLRTKPAVEHVQQVEQRIKEETAVTPRILELKPTEPELLKLSELPKPTEEKPLFKDKDSVPAPIQSSLVSIPAPVPAPAPIITITTVPAITPTLISAPAISGCQFYIGVGGVKMELTDLKSTVADRDGDGLTDDRELKGSPATNVDNPDSDGDCVTDGAEVEFFRANAANQDTDNDGYTDNFEITEYGNELLIHPSLTVAQAKGMMEVLSNSALFNLLLSAGYLTDDDSRFKAPAALNPFYPDKDKDGVGDLWEILFYKTDPFDTYE